MLLVEKELATVEIDHRRKLGHTSNPAAHGVVKATVETIISRTPASLQYMRWIGEWERVISYGYAQGLPALTECQGS